MLFCRQIKNNPGHICVILWINDLGHWITWINICDPLSNLIQNAHRHLGYKVVHLGNSLMAKFSMLLKTSFIKLAYT